MSTTKECRACFTEIDARASVCAHCGTLQKKLKALSLYVAGLIGLITLVASTTTYLYSQFVEALISRNPISILTYVQGMGAVFLNKSQNPVYIRSVVLLGNNRHNMLSEEIQIIIEGKSFKKYNSPRQDFVLSPDLEDRRKHWSEAWEGRSACFDIIALSDKAWMDKALIESVIGEVTYVQASDGRVVEADISMKAALLLRNKPECRGLGPTGTIFK